MGIDLNIENQLKLLDSFYEFYRECPFQAKKQEGMRYYYENDFYSYSDAITLYCMIRHSKPRKIIEVGSGFSSCVILDVNQQFFDNEIKCTFIEPYPKRRLLPEINEQDKSSIEIIEKNVQEVDIEVFTQLQEGDILLIDSTHVSKIGSDVNLIFFEILPNLSKGVYIHFHDIFSNFDYPKKWIYNKKRFWTESYILRAFLQYNSSYEIVLFTNYILKFYKEHLEKEMPLLFNNIGGNIWIKKDVRQKA